MQRLVNVWDTLRSRQVRNGLFLALGIALVVVFRVPLNDWLATLDDHPDRMRIAAITGMALSGLVIGLGLARTLPLVRNMRRLLTARFSQRALGWWQDALSAAFLALMLLIGGSSGETGMFTGLTPLGALYVALPAAAGVRFALLISLEDEPALELQLAASRPLWWLVCERGSVTAIRLLALGLLGTLAALSMEARPLDQVGETVLVWLPATVFLAGIGLRLSISTRQIVFGVIGALAGWISFFLFDGALARHPLLWPLSPLMTADHPILNLPAMLPAADYALNRILVLLLGGALVVLTLAELHSEEWVLTGRRPRIGTNTAGKELESA